MTTPILGLKEYFYYYHDFILITHYLIVSCLLTESADNFMQYITPILRAIVQQVFVFSLQIYICF